MTSADISPRGMGGYDPKYRPLALALKGVNFTSSNCDIG
jgi:hypothetical protein